MLQVGRDACAAGLACAAPDGLSSRHSSKHSSSATYPDGELKLPASSRVAPSEIWEGFRKRVSGLLERGFGDVSHMPAAGCRNCCVGSICWGGPGGFDRRRRPHRKLSQLQVFCTVSDTPHNCFLLCCCHVGCPSPAASLLWHTRSLAAADRAMLQLRQHSDAAAAVPDDYASSSRCKHGGGVYVFVPCSMVSLPVAVWLQPGPGG